MYHTEQTTVRPYMDVRVGFEIAIGSDRRWNSFICCQKKPGSSDKPGFYFHLKILGVG